MKGDVGWGMQDEAQGVAVRKNIGPSSSHRNRNAGGAFRMSVRNVSCFQPPSLFLSILSLFPLRPVHLPSQVELASKSS